MPAKMSINQALLNFRAPLTCSIWRLITLAYFSAFAIGAVRTSFHVTLKENTHKLTGTVKVTCPSFCQVLPYNKITRR